MLRSTGQGNPFLHIRMRIIRPHRFHRSNEPVAAPRHGLDVTRCFRVVAKRVPDLLDGEVETVLKIYNGLVAPDLVPDFFPRYQLGRVTNEQGEDFERLRRQMKKDTGPPQLRCLEVQFEDTEAYFRARSCLGHTAAPVLSVRQPIVPLHCKTNQGRLDAYFVQQPSLVAMG